MRVLGILVLSIIALLCLYAAGVFFLISPNASNVFAGIIIGLIGLGAICWIIIIFPSRRKTMSKPKRPYTIQDTLNLDARNAEQYWASVETLSAPNTGGFINIYYGPNAGMTEVWLHGTRDSIQNSSARANARLDELVIGLEETNCAGKIGHPALASQLRSSRGAGVAMPERPAYPVCFVRLALVVAARAGTRSRRAATGPMVGREKLPESG